MDDADAGPTCQGVYVPMRDGVRIAVDLYLPPGLSAGDRIPVVMRATRYWRAMIGGDPNAQERQAGEDAGYLAAGCALVLVDVRGTGASFGSWVPWSEDEVEDLGQVVDWVVAQPWSNGRVGAVGISYDANTALALTYTGRDAVKAVVPRFPDWDAYANLTYPGGIFNHAFLTAWTEGNVSQDAGRSRTEEEASPKPVDEDVDGHLLAAAIAERDKAPPGLVPNFRDDPIAETGETIGSISPYAFRREIERSGIPLYLWASWLDAGTARGALSCFETINSPQRVIIGPWAHGARESANLFLPSGGQVAPPVEQQQRDILAFLHAHLMGEVIEFDRMIGYFTYGEEAWHTTDRWPPPSLTDEIWSFGADGVLQPSSPEAEDGSDEYAVDFEATTGTQTRWHTQLGGSEVVYPDRAEEDRRLLTYTSAPLDADYEITGSPVVTLFVRSTEPDCAFFVYLEDVEEDGRVTYVTEGQLRAMHRKVCPEPPYAAFGPYHSCERADAEPLVRGELAEVTFALFPTSILIRKGHRIRVAIAGHDTNFARIPEEGQPVFTIERSRRHPSHVVLPARARS
jgi:putative CocE/NonD family hydrolase